MNLEQKLVKYIESLTGVDSMNSTSIVSDWNSQNAIDYNTASNVFVNQI